MLCRAVSTSVRALPVSAGRRHLVLQITDAEIESSPVSTDPVKNVPVIDISEMSKAADGKMKCVKEIADACAKWGFFQVVGHGVPKDLMDRFYEQKKAFFHAPREVKNAVRRTEKNSKGFFDDELTKQKRDWKEGFDFGVQDGVMDAPGLDGQNQWPSRDALPHFEVTMKEHFTACTDLSRRLVEAMAVGLDLPPSYFHKHFERHSSFSRLNYYPPCPAPSNHMCIYHHTDAGAVTVLTQTAVKSLQVFNEDDRTWYEVEPIEEAFVINTGDIMQVWSNDLYRAPLHRVKTQLELERYSTPYFYNPSYDTDYAPVAPQCKSRPPLYKPINWGQFRLARYGGDYADVGTENQISHYRIA